MSIPEALRWTPTQVWAIELDLRVGTIRPRSRARELPANRGARAGGGRAELAATPQGCSRCVRPRPPSSSAPERWTRRQWSRPRDHLAMLGSDRPDHERQDARTPRSQSQNTLSSSVPEISVRNVMRNERARPLMPQRRSSSATVAQLEGSAGCGNACGAAALYGPDVEYRRRSVRVIRSLHRCGEARSSSRLSANGRARRPWQAGAAPRRA